MHPFDLTLDPRTDPTAVYRHRDGIHAVDLLITGLVWLDLFTSLDREPAALEEICNRFQITPRPADVMLTLFTAMGFLESDAGVFRPSALAQEHLVEGSPWFLGPYYASLKERPVCRDYLAVLRTGKPANWGSFKDEKAWAQAMEDEAFARQFTAAMDCRGRFLGRALARTLDLAGQTRLLDIAGGSGIYACALVAANPRLRATVIEKPPVDRICSRLIEERGFGDRIEVVCGDMFLDPLPSGHDVHLLSNVVHDWDTPVVRRLCSSSFAALEPGGWLVVHDAHINAEKTGPLHVAEYSALLMHTTEGKCYSVAEIAEILDGIGFKRFSFAPTAAARSFVRAQKP